MYAGAGSVALVVEVAGLPIAVALLVDGHVPEAGLPVLVVLRRLLHQLHLLSKARELPPQRRARSGRRALVRGHGESSPAASASRPRIGDGRVLRSQAQRQRRRSRTGRRRSEGGAVCGRNGSSLRHLHRADVAGGSLRSRDAALIHGGEREPVGDQPFQVLLALEHVAERARSRSRPPGCGPPPGCPARGWRVSPRPPCQPSSPSIGSRASDDVGAGASGRTTRR